MFDLALFTPLADWDGPGPWILLLPLFWFAVVFLFFFVFRRAGWGPGCGWGGPGRGWRQLDATDLLDRRFAEGEISAEEYRSRRSTLKQKEQS
jgi:putative membrane protein